MPTQKTISKNRARRAGDKLAQAITPPCPHCLELDERNEALVAKNGELAEQVEELGEQVEELAKALAAAKRAGKRQAAPFGRGKRKKNPKKPGRKNGHPGAQRKPPGDEEIDRNLIAPPLDGCPNCGGALKDKKNEKNYQTDLPPIQPEITCFEFESGYCPCCRERIYSHHEEQISTATGAAAHHLGPRILAFEADLKARLGIPYRKITEILEQRFGLRVTAGALAQANERLARRAEPTVYEIKEALRQEALAHADETGWPVAMSRW